MKIRTEILRGSEKEIRFEEFEEGDQVIMVDGRSGVIRFHPPSNGLRIFSPSSPQPQHVLDRPIVGQWPEKWLALDVEQENRGNRMRTIYSWWPTPPRLAINKNEAFFVDFHAWARAFSRVYSAS